MDPVVRYVNSADGTRIAYCSMGEGPALAYLAIPSLSNVRRTANEPAMRAFFDSIGRGRQLIRLDFRGCGGSQRQITERSVDALLSDLIAVLDGLRIEEVDLFSEGARGSIAIRAAVRYPRRVRKVLLLDAILTPAGAEMPGIPGFGALMKSNYQMFLEMVAQRLSGRPLAEVGPIIDLMRAGIDGPENLAQLLANESAGDFELAQQIRCPVLVATHGDPNQDNCEQLAALLHDGAFTILPRTSRTPPFGDGSAVEELVRQFFPVATASERGPVAALSPQESRVLAMLSAGKTNAEIAVALTLSVRTVERHITNVYGKIGVRNRSEATAWSVKQAVG